MGLDLEYTDGQTPIDPDERKGLLVRTITSKYELDEFEQFNIQEAVEWSLKFKFTREKILSEKFIRDLHRKMFGKVWKWAGQFRDTNKNIGADKFQIPARLKQLLDDCNYWIINQTFPEDEISIRFKHKLVSIHLFPNGNGRHSRLMADIIVSKIFYKPVFSWGRNSMANNPEARNLYLQALREADNGNYRNLIKFARS